MTADYTARFRRNRGRCPQITQIAANFSNKTEDLNPRNTPNTLNLEEHALSCPNPWAIRAGLAHTAPRTPAFSFFASFRTCRAVALSEGTRLVGNSVFKFQAP